MVLRTLFSVVAVVLIAALVAVGQPPMPKDQPKPETTPLAEKSNSFRLMMIPNGDAHVNVDSQPVRVFLISKVANTSQGARKAVFSRWCTVAPQQNGKPFYELDEASLNFTVLLPDSLPDLQTAEVFKQLGLDEKVTLIPSEAAGLKIRVSNGGQHEDLLVQAPTATSQLPSLYHVSENVSNVKLLTLLRTKPDQTSVHFEVFARQEAELRKGFTATRIAMAMNEISDKLGFPKDARKIAVSADVKRYFLSELATFIALSTKDFETAEALKIVQNFSSEWERCGSVDLEKVKTDLVVIGNETLRQNMAPSKFMDVKTKFQEAGATEKISQTSWNIVSAAALEAKSEHEFKKLERFSR